jgi:hypothetical protein
MTFSPQESANRDAVVERILECIRGDQIIKLPDFDPALSRASEQYALTSIGLEPNPYGGAVGEFRYQFEGEEDLLHLIVTRVDSEPLTVEEAQDVVGWVLPDLPPALIWLRPGHYSQHFYFGHDELCRHTPG